MGILKEEYVPIADALLTSLARELAIFQAENHLFNAAYLSVMQSKTDEVRASCCSPKRSINILRNESRYRNGAAKCV